MNLRQRLSNVLRNVKEDSGLTYKEISDKSGCSITSVRYALNGGDNVGLTVFDKLFEAMGVIPCILCEYKD